MAINKDSGSIYPGSSLLEKQLGPTQGHYEMVPSRRVKGGAPLWSSAYTDLNRLGRLEVNGAVIDPAQAPQGVKKADYVFQQLEEKLDSTTLAIHAAQLLEQQTAGGVLKMLNFQKGLVHPHPVDGKLVAKATLSEAGRISKLDTTQTDFTLIMESLRKKMEVAESGFIDPNQTTYFKMRITIQGKKEALERRDAEALSIKAAYTEEKGSKEEALKLDYFGTRAGLFDSTSYLKA